MAFFPNILNKTWNDKVLDFIATTRVPLFELIYGGIFLLVCLIVYKLRLYFLVATCCIWLLYWLLSPQKSLAKLDTQRLTACIVGSGFSGIGMAIKLKELGLKYRIVEKSSSLGGTWNSNRYPGCCCDIPSHLYSFSFFLNPNWSKHFCHQKEILEYLHNVVKHYDLKIDYDKHVVEASWRNEDKKWEITFDDGEIYEADILVSACGPLHVPKNPNLRGVGQFRGSIIHSASWDDQINLSDKNVGIIGTGTSAVQIIPAIVNKVQNLYVFQRSASWVGPKIDKIYSNITKKIFKYFPFVMYIYRAMLFWYYELFYYLMFYIKSPTVRIDLASKIMTLTMKHQVKNEKLALQLLPDYTPGCKRIALSNDYLSAFNSPNITLDCEKINKVTKFGIDTASNQYNLDVIIYATGFSVLDTYRPFSIKANSTTMKQEMGDTPRAYLGITCSKFPNFYYLLGPNTGLGHNSLIYMLECQINYIANCICHMVKNNFRSMVLTSDADQRYQVWQAEKMKLNVFHSGCQSWYTNDKGINYVLWPSDCTQYWWKTRKVSIKDYNWCR